MTDTNFFDQFDSSAPEPGGNFFDQFDASAPPAQAGGDATFSRLVEAIRGRESSGNAGAVSKQGARGSMQIMPKTFEQYAKPGEDFGNEEHRNAAALRKLEDDYRFYKGDVEKTAAAYLGGRGAVRADGSIRDDVKDAEGTTPLTYAKQVAQRLGRTSGSNRFGYREPASADLKVITPPEAKPEGAPTGTDYAKSFGAGVLSGAGMIFQGGGELLARGLNAVAGTDLTAANPFQGAIDWLNESRTDAAKRAEQDSQIKGNLLDPATWDFGKNPNVRGIALQGLNTLGQFAPNLAVALATGGMSLPAQAAVGATAGGVQAFGGGAGEEREKYLKMTPAEIEADSSLYRELRAKGVDHATAQKAVAEAAALGGGLGNAIPSAAEGGFENFLIGLLTRGRLKMPGLGIGIAGRTISGTVGGALTGGGEEAVEQMGQNLGVKMAVGSRRDIGEDTLGQFAMGALGEGTLGAVGGAASKPLGSTAKPPAPGAPVPADETAPAAYHPDQVKQAVAFGEKRLADLESAAKGTEATKTTDDFGNEVEIPGVPSRILSDTEKAEIKFLRENAGNGEAIARAYGLTPRPAEPKSADLTVMPTSTADGQASVALEKEVLSGEKGKAGGGDALRPRVDAVLETLRQPGYLAAVAAQDPQAKDELLHAAAVARNPKADPLLRERALAGLEQRLADLGNVLYRPDFTMPAPQPSTAMVPSRGFGIGAARPAPDTSIPGEAVRVTETLPGPAGAALPAPTTPVGPVMVNDGTPGSTRPQTMADLEASVNTRQREREAAARAQELGLNDGAAGAVAARNARDALAVDRNPPAALPAPETPSGRPVLINDTDPELTRGEQIGDLEAQRNREQGARERAARDADLGITAGTREAIDAAAHRAATSPHNDLREPTEGQKAAGNYQKGHVRVAGLDVAIENPAGSKRRPEWPTLRSHYGYVKRTEGADGDQVDVFVRPGTAEGYDGPVFVVDQKSASGRFDEHKAMIGWPDEASARAGYLENYTPGWNGIRAVTRMSAPEFRSWLETGDTTRPAAGHRVRQELEAAKLKDEIQRAVREARALEAQGISLGTWLADADILSAEQVQEVFGDEGKASGTDSAVVRQGAGEARQPVGGATGGREAAGAGSRAGVDRNASQGREQPGNPGGAGKGPARLKPGPFALRGKWAQEMPSGMLGIIAKQSKSMVERAVAKAELDRRNPTREADRVAHEARRKLWHVIVQSGGMSEKEAADIGIDPKSIKGYRLAGFITPDGMRADILARTLAENGYLTPRQMEDGGDEAARQVVADLLAREFVGDEGQRQRYMELLAEHHAARELAATGAEALPSVDLAEVADYDDSGEWGAVESDFKTREISEAEAMRLLGFPKEEIPDGRPDTRGEESLREPAREAGQDVAGGEEGGGETRAEPTASGEGNQEGDREGATAVAEKPRLYVQSPDGRRFKVDDYEDASRKWLASGDVEKRASSMATGAVPIVDQDGKTVALMGVNGRVTAFDGSGVLYAPPEADVTPADDDAWLKELFVETAAETPVAPIEDKADLAPVRAAIAAVRASTERDLADWQGRAYKQNKNQVELRGDGPSRRESLSIGGINEARRNKAIAALQGQLAALEKIEAQIATPEGARALMRMLDETWARAVEGVKADAGSRFKTAGDLFEYLVLQDQQPARGAIDSNPLSRALRALKETPKTKTRAKLDGQKRATAQAAIDAFNADDAKTGMEIVAKLKLDALKEVGAAIGFSVNFTENATRYRERLATVADRLTKSARDQSGRERKLFDRLSSLANDWDRMADHTGAPEGSYDGKWMTHPDARKYLVAELDKLKGDPDFYKVAPMVRKARPRLFDAAEAAKPVDTRTADEKMADFRKMVAEQKANRARLEAKLERLFLRDGGVRATRNDSKTGQYILLTAGTTEAPYRVTSIDDEGPSGHRDYNSIAEAANEFAHSVTIVDGPAPRAKAVVTPQVASPGMLKTFIGIAADSIEQLRKVDVDRVLTSNPKIYQAAIAQHIRDKRPDLADEVDAVLADLAPAQEKGAAETAEQAIRAAVDAVTERTIGSWYPITVEFGGRAQQFLSNIKAVRSDGKTKPSVSLVQIRMGRMLSGQPAEPLFYGYRLTGKNELTEEGIPRRPSDAELARWERAFGKVGAAAEPITPDAAANMQRGDIVRDSKGVEYYAWSARFGRIDVVPLKDGKPVVHAGSAIRFALDANTREANPEYRTDPLYLVRKAINAEFQALVDAIETRETEGGVEMFHRTREDLPAMKFRTIESANGLPTFANDRVALAMPRLKDGAEPGLRRMAFDIVDVPAAKAGLRKGLSQKSAREAATVGKVLVDVNADGHFVSFRNIEVDEERRNNGHAGAVVASMLANNPKGMDMQVWDILPDARAWWDARGVKRNFSDIDMVVGKLNTDGYLTARDRHGPDRFRRDSGSPEEEVARADVRAADAGGGEGGRGGLRQAGGGADEGRVAAVRAQIAPALERWKNAPPVRVVASTDDLPIGPRIREMRAEREVRGWFDGTTAWLVAGNLKTQRDALETLFHEVAGHFGLRGILGPQMDAVLQEVYAGNERAIRELVAKEYDHLDLKQRAHRMMAAEEFLSLMAQRRPNDPLRARVASALKRVVAMIRDFIRGLGVDLKLNDADLEALVARARRFVEDGVVRDGVARGKEAAFSKTDTPEAFSRATEAAAGAWERATQDGYRETAKRVMGWIDSKFDPIGNLADKAEYLRQRYRTLGNVSRADEIAKGIRAAFADATPEDAQAAYDFMTTPGAKADAIKSASVRAHAEATKATIESVGDALVDRGLLSAEAREAHRGGYLPRVYLRHLLNESDWKALGSGKKPSQMGYLKKRKDIPEDVRKVILGEITDPAFLSSMAVARPMRDMALLDWLHQISGNENWILPESVVEFDGRRVSAYWLKDEAAQLRKQARYYQAADAEKASAMAARMEAAADDALGEMSGEHTEFRQIPNTARYGRLRGMFVRKEIYDDLMGIQDFQPANPNWAQSLLGYGGWGTKLTQLWKTSKVALNPPGQVRNFLSNAVMLQLSGVPLIRVPERMIQAMRDISSNGRYYEIAKRYGVTEATFSAQEIGRMRRDLIELELQDKQLNPVMRAFKRVHRLAAIVTDFAGDLYQKSETIFKTAKIIDAMERQKMSEADAALEAHRWMFDYSLVPQSVRYLRNAPVGVPFATYIFKVAPRLLEVALAHPQRLLPWAALFYAMPMLVAAGFDVGDDDLEKLKKALPEFLQEKGHAMFLPYRDEMGRIQVVDLGYFFPWSQWTELARNLGGAAKSAANGEVPTGDLGKAVQSAGIFGGPLADIIIAMKTGQDPFTKREIWNKNDPAGRQAADMLNYLYSMAAPPFLTSRGVVSPMGLIDERYGGKAVQAATGTTDRYGDPRATAEQAALALIGINLYAVDADNSFAQNVARMEFEMREVERRLKQQLKDRAMPQEKREEIVREYQGEMRRRGEKLMQYVDEAKIHPNLKTKKPESALQ